MGADRGRARDGVGSLDSLFTVFSQSAFFRGGCGFFSSSLSNNAAILLALNFGRFRSGLLRGRGKVRNVVVNSALATALGGFGFPFGFGMTTSAGFGFGVFSGRDFSFGGSVNAWVATWTNLGGGGGANLAGSGGGDGVLSGLELSLIHI